MSNAANTDLTRELKNRKMVRQWLYFTALMLLCLVVVGGATRLTDSGLSITEWKPIHGVIPPLSEAAWEEELQKYRQIPEYQLINKGMSMDEFKFIFWWEWAHRFLARSLGLVFALPLAFFWVTGRLDSRIKKPLLGLLALGGLQGFIGWWMVASGIGETDRLDVAPYRLMTHFGLALLIIAITAWFWFDLSEQERKPGSDKLRWLAIGILGLTSFQMMTGALVAGLDAGRSYTDWPLMAGELVPSHYMDAELGVRSLFEGRAATQFNHRAGAYLLWAIALFAAFQARGTILFKGFGLIALLVSAQAVWGIITLVNAAPLPIALVHQGLGVLVLLAAIWIVWVTRPQTALNSQTAPA